MKSQDTTEEPRGVRRLELQPDPICLKQVKDAVNHVCRAASFSSVQTREIATSTEEACKQLIHYSHEIGCSESLILSFAVQDQACIVDIAFNPKLDEKILLGFPQEASSARATSNRSVEMPSVWHEVIAHTMDRVFLVEEGRGRIIRMIKYRRTEAQAGLFWLMVLTPRLRDDLTFHVYRDAQGQDVSSLLQDEKTGAELKFNGATTWIIDMIDGNHTFYEIYLEYTSRFSPISPEQLAEVFYALEGAAMLADQGPRTGQGKARKRAWLSNLVFVLPHADRFVTWLHQRLSFLYHPLMVAFLIAFCLSGFIPLFGEVRALHELLLLPSLLIAENPAILLHVYVIVLISLFLHELAHGLTCKHFGGDVNRFGAMFILGMFAFFCDTSSAWNFPEKYKRILVTLAGPLVNLFFMSFCFWVWHFSKPHTSSAGSFWFIAGFVSLFMFLANLIPFIKLDGYFILMDLTGIANLREKSFLYLKNMLSSPFSRRQRDLRPADSDVSRKWALLVYGALSVPVTVFFLAIPFIEFYVAVWRKHPSHFRVILLGTILVFVTIALGTRLYGKIWQHYHRVYGVRARIAP